MSDLIDRQAAIEIVRVRCARIPTMAIRAMQELKDLPTEEPERKRGRWITRNDNQGMYYECSECGGILTRISCFEREFSVVPSYNSIAKTDYCPSCGAQMEKGEEQT